MRVGGFCHSWIFGLGVELLILSILAGFGAVVNVLVCRIWGEVGEEATTAERSITEGEHTIKKVA
jgi:hypothetical protein